MCYAQRRVGKKVIGASGAEMMARSEVNGCPVDGRLVSRECEGKHAVVEWRNEAEKFNIS